MVGRYGVAVLILAGLVVATTRSSAQTDSVKTYTAPPVRTSNASEEVIPLVYAVGEEIEPPEAGLPKFTLSKLSSGNEYNLPPGFYATFHPKTTDTVMIFDSSSEHYSRVQTRAGKEIIQGDSGSVVRDMLERMGDYDSQGKLVPKPIKRGKTNSLVTRSGFIPSQGIGSKRWVFAVCPGAFKITPNSIISASVHILHSENNIGNILCAITKIDYEHNRFFVETSNEVPLGENINWIIVTAP